MKTEKSNRDMLQDVVLLYEALKSLNLSCGHSNEVGDILKQITDKYYANHIVATPKMNEDGWHCDPTCPFLGITKDSKGSDFSKCTKDEKYGVLDSYHGELIAQCQD